jgi:hypothetical protein
VTNTTTSPSTRKWLTISQIHRGHAIFIMLLEQQTRENIAIDFIENFNFLVYNSRKGIIC